MTAHQPGYSDRISHALAFAAKHGAIRNRGGSTTWPTQPANVAVILARYGCDELTIVSGILAVLLNDADPHRRPELEPRVGQKFGERVMSVVRQSLEPRYDGRGKERHWEARKLDFLANLSLADQRAVEVCTAQEIHQCGALLTDVRRLGPEYLSSYAPGGGSTVLRWFTDVVSALERHHAAPRTGMLAELRELAERLEACATEDEE